MAITCGNYVSSFILKTGAYNAFKPFLFVLIQVNSSIFFKEWAFCNLTKITFLQVNYISLVKLQKAHSLKKMELLTYKNK